MILIRMFVLAATVSACSTVAWECQVKCSDCKDLDMACDRETRTVKP